jgi:hypothetical protein
MKPMAVIAKRIGRSILAGPDGVVFWVVLAAGVFAAVFGN